MAESATEPVSGSDSGNGRPERRSLLQRAGGKALRLAKEQLLRDPPPNFTWAISWFVTEVCNLRCKYCFINFQKQHPPMEPHLETLLAARPKYLMTVGGEPLLVPWLPEALRILRKEVNPWTVLTTNALVSRDRVREVLPLINALVVSLDGLGEQNKANRGIDGAKVLAALRDAWGAIRADGLTTELSINVVVSRDSYRGIPELYRAIRDISDEIGMCVNPVTPYTDPLSVASDPALYQEYLDLVRDVSKDPRTDFCGPGRDEFYALQAAPGDASPADGPAPGLSAQSLPQKTRSGHHRIQCLRQFVWANVWSDGHLAVCNPEYFMGAFKKDLASQLGHRRYLSAFQTGVLMFDKLVRHKTGADCYHPCNCLPFLDDIINSAEGAPPRWAEWFRGRFTEEEVEASDRFFRTHHGRELSQSVKDVFLDRS